MSAVRGVCMWIKTIKTNLLLLQTEDAECKNTLSCS